MCVTVGSYLTAGSGQKFGPYYRFLKSPGKMWGYDFVFKIITLNFYVGAISCSMFLVLMLHRYLVHCYCSDPQEGSDPNNEEDV